MLFRSKANTYTGAVSTITHEQLQSVGNANIISSLKNIDPSFMIIDNLELGSDPNALPDIQMRGQTGFSDVVSGQTNPNQPLFILDGFETTLTKVLDLDMNLVQSVTLLKDATAKAMYGSKAGNGVIVIETKRPEEGQIRISYNGNFTIDAPDLSSYNLCDVYQKVEAERNAGFYTIKPGASFENQISLNDTYSTLMKHIGAGVNTDWLSKPLRTGFGQKHAAYLEGGDRYMLYGVNISYNDVKGVMKGSDRQTIDGTLSLTYRYKNLQFRNQLNITNNVANNSPYGSFAAFSLMNPYQAIYDEDGNMQKVCTNGLTTQKNPLWNGTINTIDRTKYTYITENFYAEWRVLEQLKLTGRFGVTKNIGSSDDFKPSGHTNFHNYSGDDLYKAGSYLKGNSVNDQISGDLGAEYSINYKKNLLFFNVMANINETRYDLASYMAQGFASDDMKHISFSTEYGNSKPNGTESISRSFGVIGSINYSYDNRYLFDANYRPNGSSEFGSNNRWGSFWSLGAGWNVHNEKFMQNLWFVNNLKARVSTGFTGTQGFSIYDAIATLNYYTDQQYSGSIGSYLIGLANPDLKWQKK